MLAIALRVLKGGRVHAFARKKKESFIYGGAIEFLNEVYICFSFSFIINMYDIGRFRRSPSFTVDSIFAIVVGLIVIFAPCAILVQISRHWARANAQVRQDYLASKDKLRARIRLRKHMAVRKKFLQEKSKMMHCSQAKHSRRRRSR